MITRWSIFIWVGYCLKDVQNVGEDWTYLSKIPVGHTQKILNKNLGHFNFQIALENRSSWPIMNFAIGMCCKRGYFVQQVLTKYSLFQRSRHTLDHDLSKFEVFEKIVLQQKSHQMEPTRSLDRKGPLIPALRLTWASNLNLTLNNPER